MGTHGNLRIAVIDENIVTCVGLRTILNEVVPFAQLSIYTDINTFIEDRPEEFFHYFVSAGLFIQNQVFFSERNKKTIVLTAKDEDCQIPDTIRTINVTQTEESLIKSILSIHQSAHSNGYHVQEAPVQNKAPKLLSNREAEVLTLVVKGFMNKEIADRLNISITTVITHRRNITDKLNIKSVSGLTIYAVTHGYIDIETL